MENNLDNTENSKCCNYPVGYYINKEGEKIKFCTQCLTDIKTKI